MPATVRNSLSWVLEALERDPTFVHKSMFGTDAAYIDGRLCLAAGDRGDPWNGMLVSTSQDHHASLIAQMPALQPHPVLGKWLYVPQTDPAFESIVQQVTALILARDPRIGVEPKPKRSRKRTLPKTS